MHHQPQRHHLVEMYGESITNKFVRGSEEGSLGEAEEREEGRDGGVNNL